MHMYDGNEMEVEGAVNQRAPLSTAETDPSFAKLDMSQLNLKGDDEEALMEDCLLDSDSDPPPMEILEHGTVGGKQAEEAPKGPVLQPKAKLTRGQLRKKRIEEARLRGDPILTKEERKEQWLAKHRARSIGKTQSSTKGLPKVDIRLPSMSTPPPGYSSAQLPAKRNRSEITPDSGGRDIKKSRTSQVTDRRPYSETLSSSKIAIVHKDHPERKLSEGMASHLRSEIARRAMKGINVRVASAHLEDGGLVLNCVNQETESWLQKQFTELVPMVNVPLKIGPADSLIHVTKVTAWIPKSTEANDKSAVLKGLKQQNGLRTELWSVVGGRSTKDGQYFVFHVDEESHRRLEEEFGMKPFLGLERITFKLAAKTPHQQPNPSCR